MGSKETKFGLGTASCSATQLKGELEGARPFHVTEHSRAWSRPHIDNQSLKIRELMSAECGSMHL